MAEAGAYGALKSTPTISGGFEAEGSFARMAQERFRQRAEERAEQRKLAAEGRQAISNAIGSMNIDMGKIDESLRGSVGALLDYSKGKLTDASLKWQQDPSYKNQLEVQRIQSEFISKVNTLSSMGSTMKDLANNRGNYSQLLSAPVYNGLSEFNKNIVPMAGTFDPETMTVEYGGKRQPLTGVFNGLVDVTKLVPKTDLDESLAKYTGLFINQNTKSEKTENKNGKEVKTVYYDVDMKDARSVFANRFAGTNEKKELAAQVVSEYEAAIVSGDTQRAEEMIADGHISLDKEGLPYATDENLFNKVKDEYFPAPKTFEKPIEYKGPTQSQLSAAKQQEDEFAKVIDIDKLWTNAGSDKLYGLPINHGMRKGQATTAKMSYDPVTGESSATVFYEYVGRDGNKRVGAMREKEASDAAKQRTGRSLDAKFSYIDSKEKQKSAGAYSEVKPEGANLANRAEAFDVEIQDNAYTMIDLMSELGGDEEKILDGLIKKEGSIIKSAGVPALSSYLTDTDNFRIPYTYGEEVELGGRVYDLTNMDRRDALARRLSAMKVTAQNMKVSGFSDEDIQNAVHELAIVDDNSFNSYTFDPLARESASRGYDTTKLNELLISGTPSNEALQIIRGSKKEATKDIYEGLTMSRSDIDRKVKVFQANNKQYGLSDEEALSELKKQGFVK